MLWKASIFVWIILWELAEDQYDPSFWKPLFFGRFATRNHTNSCKDQHFFSCPQNWGLLKKISWHQDELEFFLLRLCFLLGVPQKFVPSTLHEAIVFQWFRNFVPLIEGYIRFHDVFIQEISNGRTHERTDPEKTWVSNSSIATYVGQGSVGIWSLPQFLMEFRKTWHDSFFLSILKGSRCLFRLIQTLVLGCYLPNVGFSQPSCFGSIPWAKKWRLSTDIFVWKEVRNAKKKRHVTLLSDYATKRWRLWEHHLEDSWVAGRIRHLLKH